ncbi:hypothetical protein Mapa_010383 [Marchantia paleacea]|nr:hypothetical protein Mapa_010383 [Marchantia paleacea]
MGFGRAPNLLQGLVENPLRKENRSMEFSDVQVQTQAHGRAGNVCRAYNVTI